MADSIELTHGRGVPAARVVAVKKSYALGRTTVPALRGVDLVVEQGAFTVLTGPSGSGKSSLLNLLGCLDRPDSGRVEIAGVDVSTLEERALARFRAERLGFVFQNFNLLPVLTALENVEYPLQLCVSDRAERRRLAFDALASVGLGDLVGRRPGALSGGQRQRVAIARALVKKPALVLADEPTANLDRATSADIIALMREMQRAAGTTFIFSSHDPHLIGAADTVLHLSDGRLSSTASPSASLASNRKEIVDELV